MLARGLSVRDMEDAFRDEEGRLLLSRTAVSEIGERLWADYQEFAGRDLCEYDVDYLFVDGIAEHIRPRLGRMLTIQPQCRTTRKMKRMGADGTGPRKPPRRSSWPVRR